ncbi:MAG: hypothetical protein JXQ72_09225 [Anaerolineae bacterium]|nr:hypothetical protein [Anaerolineae bacterium]
MSSTQFSHRGGGCEPAVRHTRPLHCTGIITTIITALIVLAALLPGITTPAAAISPGAGCFGVVEAYFRPQDARDLGVSWERIVFEWPTFQPTGPDEFIPAIPESRLIDAKQAGREVVGLLKNTPFWASGGNLLGLPPTGLDRPIDDPLNYWAAFVTQTVTIYGDVWGIDHWIIFNEPDLRPGDITYYEFDGEVADYYQMLKVAYQAAKAANPDAVIHVAGMAWWPDVAANREPYLSRLLEVASRDPDAHQNGFFFDGATVHSYFGTDNLWDMLAATRAILWNYGLMDKTIWIGETNARPTFDSTIRVPDHPLFEVSLNQQADYVVQAAALSLAADVECFAIYRLYDNHFLPGASEPWGLVRVDGSRRPAFEAYQTVIRAFGGTERARRFASDHALLVTLEQDRHTVYVVWAREAVPVRFHIAADGADHAARWLRLDGVADAITPVQVPGAAGWWFVVDAPGAALNITGYVAVAGTPAILVIDGPPRNVWVLVQGKYWTLR